MLLSHDFSGARNEFVAARALTPECPSALANLESSNLLARPPRPQRGNHLLFSFTANLDSRSRWTGMHNGNDRGPLQTIDSASAC
jgi:hypothetical protein